MARLGVGVLAGRVRIVLAGLAVLAGVALWSPHARAQSSEWTTDFGPLVLVVRNGDVVTGAFADYGGRFEGGLARQTATIRGLWRQPTSEVRCAEPVSGTHYWGRVVWQVGRDGTLLGRWNYCHRPPASGGRWDGTLSQGTNPLETGGADAHPAGSSAPAADPKAAAAPAKPRSAPASIAPEPHADALEMARFLWGQAIDPARLTVLREDVTCDARADLTLAYHNLDAAEGPFFEVAVRETGATLEQIPIAAMDFDTGTFASLCGGGGRISVTVEGGLLPVDVEALTGLSAPPLCRLGLRIDDGMCDALWVFTMRGQDRLTDLVIGRN